MKKKPRFPSTFFIAKRRRSALENEVMDCGLGARWAVCKWSRCARRRPSRCQSAWCACRWWVSGCRDAKCRSTRACSRISWWCSSETADCVADTSGWFWQESARASRSSCPHRLGVPTNAQTLHSSRRPSFIIHIELHNYTDENYTVKSWWKHHGAITF